MISLKLVNTDELALSCMLYKRKEHCHATQQSNKLQSVISLFSLHIPCITTLPLLDLGKSRLHDFTASIPVMRHPLLPEASQMLL
jgi:hypothetical protein